MTADFFIQKEKMVYRPGRCSKIFTHKLFLLRHHHLCTKLVFQCLVDNPLNEDGSHYRGSNVIFWKSIYKLDWGSGSSVDIFRIISSNLNNFQRLTQPKTYVIPYSSDNILQMVLTLKIIKTDLKSVLPYFRQTQGKRL